MAKVMVYNRTQESKSYIRKGHVIRIPVNEGVMLSEKAAEEVMEKLDGLSYMPPHVAESGGGTEEILVKPSSVDDIDQEVAAVIEGSGVQQLTGMLRILVPEVDDIKGISGGSSPKGLNKDELAELVKEAFTVGGQERVTEKLREKLEGKTTDTDKTDGTDTDKIRGVPESGRTQGPPEQDAPADAAPWPANNG